MRAIRARPRMPPWRCLTPDFRGCFEHVDVVLAEAPEVFNHNLETVPRLYATVRPQAAVCALAGGPATRRHRRGMEWSRLDGWSGLGETGPEEVKDTPRGGGRRRCGHGDDRPVSTAPPGRNLRWWNTCGLRCSRHYREWGEALGLQVHAAPFVRSSFTGRPARAVRAGPRAGYARLGADSTRIHWLTRWMRSAGFAVQ